MRREHGFTLVELVIVVSIVGVVAGIAIPNMLRSRMVANESACVANLRTIKTQQLVFQLQTEVDQDWDDSGEAGLLCELSGEITPRNDDALGACSPVYIAPRFATAGANGRGFCEASGYLYRVFLADGLETAGDDLTLGGAGNGPGQGGAMLDPDVADTYHAINLQEKCYVCYAWPLAHQGTGTRAFVVNVKSQVHATGMANAIYDGFNAPINDYAAAYWDDGSTDTWFNNTILSGRAASDGNVWTKTDG